MAEWEVRVSKSKRLPYFYNSSTGKSTWDPPQELTEDQIKNLPGAHLLNEEEEKDKGRDGQVRASHFLVKHRESRRPSSWKEPNITRTKEEAIKILRDYEAQINGSEEKFSELAQKYSDCASHTHRGDVGWFSKGQMQKPFEEAVHALKIGQISDIVSTDSGVHLIMRTG